jgi:hypothetical protein
VSERGSGQLVALETITLLDDFNRSRVIKRFSESGMFTKVYASHEIRVIDSHTGAMMKP